MRIRVSAEELDFKIMEKELIKKHREKAACERRLAQMAKKKAKEQDRLAKEKS